MRKFGLIGKSLGHSFSASFFEQYFKEHQIHANYSNIEIDNIDQIKNVLREDYEGLNITIPYKEAILSYLDELSPLAEKIGAVNTVKMNQGKICGYNTDVYGFHQSIKPFFASQHERAIIFGTGGASKAVEFVLKSLGVDVIFISRNPNAENHFTHEEVNENMLNACKMLVNCTPVGTFPNIDDAHKIPYQVLTKEHLVVDLIYNPEKTKFLRTSEKEGAMILNGEPMLRHQAMKSWEIWNAEG